MTNWNFFRSTGVLKPLFITATYLSIVFSGCGGGFHDDSDNASEFENPLFSTERIHDDTTNSQAGP